MDKIFSARVDEAVLNKISLLAHKLHISQKRVIESAVELFAQKMEAAGEINIFEQTSGAWKRQESLNQTVDQAKSAFKKSMNRYQQ